MGETNISSGKPLQTWTVDNPSDFDLPPDAADFEENDFPLEEEDIANPFFQKKPLRQDPRQRQERRSEPQKQVLADNYEDVARLRQKFRQEAEQTVNAREVHAQRQIEMLIGFGVSSEEFSIDFKGEEHKFTFRTLNVHEQKIVGSFVQSKVRTSSNGLVLMDFADKHDSQLMCLVFSLTHIDGIDVDEILNIVNVDDETWYDQKHVFLEQLDNLLKEKLYDCYERLASDHKKAFYPETKEQAQEVAENLPKSG